MTEKGIPAADKIDECLTNLLRQINTTADFCVMFHFNNYTESNYYKLFSGGAVLTRSLVLEILMSKF